MLFGGFDSAICVCVCVLMECVGCAWVEMLCVKHVSTKLAISLLGGHSCFRHSHIHMSILNRRTGLYMTLSPRIETCVSAVWIQGKLRTLSHLLARNTKFEILDAHEEILLFIHMGFLHLAETDGNCVKGHTCQHCDHLLLVSLSTPLPLLHPCHPNKSFKNKGKNPSFITLPEIHI